MTVCRVPVVVPRLCIVKRSSPFFSIPDLLLDSVISEGVELCAAVCVRLDPILCVLDSFPIHQRLQSLARSSSLKQSQDNGGKINRLGLNTRGRALLRPRLFLPPLNPSQQSRLHHPRVDAHLHGRLSSTGPPIDDTTAVIAEVKFNLPITPDVLLRRSALPDDDLD